MMGPYRDEKILGRRFYVGTNCHVLCIDQYSGETVWQTAIHKSMNSTLVTLLTHEDRIYAGCFRMLACLDADDGRILWSTESKKFGEPVALALDPTVKGGLLIGAASGRLYAVAAESGTILWQNDLPSLSYHPICLRVPGAIIAQPIARYVSRGKATVVQVMESDQIGE